MSPRIYEVLNSQILILLMVVTSASGTKEGSQRMGSSVPRGDGSRSKYLCGGSVIHAFCVLELSDKVIRVHVCLCVYMQVVAYF